MNPNEFFSPLTSYVEHKQIGFLIYPVRNPYVILMDWFMLWYVTCSWRMNHFSYSGFSSFPPWCWICGSQWNDGWSGYLGLPLLWLLCTMAVLLKFILPPVYDVFSHLTSLKSVIPFIFSWTHQQCASSTRILFTFKLLSAIYFHPYTMPNTQTLQQIALLIFF